jgi:hypothetical protein
MKLVFAEGAIDLTPKTAWTLEETREGLLSNESHAWRSAAIALNDAFCDDIFVALQGVRQCLASVPIIKDSLNEFAPRVIHPTISSLDSIVLDVRNPEKEHSKLEEIVVAAVSGATDLREACSRYYAQLGHLPLAPAYAMSEVVSLWRAAHPDTDAWTEVWKWAHNTFGPTPRYHACSVFVTHPELVPKSKFPDLWGEILSVVHGPDKNGEPSIKHEPWALRWNLVRHFSYHLEAHLPDSHGANISCFAWWLAERVASLFPDDPTSAQFYRNNWFEPATNRSALIWADASPHIKRCFLRYMTAAVTFPWATALLSLMGNHFERLALQEQPLDTQALLHEALVLCIIGALPVALKSPAEPTYAIECPLGETALKCAALQTEKQRKDLEQLVAASQTLGSVEGLCTALHELSESSLPDQIAVGIALKAKAYTDPAVADCVWGILSDSEWRQRVLGSVEENVLGLLMEAISILQADNQDKWFSLLPHYIADLCESTEDDDRRRHLFLFVVRASLASDTVSAVRRLLRGSHKRKFVQFAKEYREHIEGTWSHHPAWVQGRLRGLLASLRAV